MTWEGLGYSQYTWFCVFHHWDTVSFALSTHMVTDCFLCSKFHTSHWDVYKTLR